MFQDEARFGRINDPRRCWAPKGFRPEVGMQIVREYTYAFGAVSPHDGNLDSLVLPVVTAEAMSIFLEEVARRHPEEFILMFLDGAGWHRANDLAVPENMRLEALPPYSPQLNPVEHIWDEIREKWFANEVFNSLDAVEDRLVEALVALETTENWSPLPQASIGSLIAVRLQLGIIIAQWGGPPCPPARSGQGRPPHQHQPFFIFRCIREGMIVGISGVQGDPPGHPYGKTLTYPAIL